MSASGSAVVVLGVAQTRHEASKSDLSLQDLIFAISRAALDDAGIDRADIDSVVIASQDVVDGRGISNMQNAAPAGAYLKDEIRVAGDGLYGLALAYLQITAGRGDIALVVSWGKPSETALAAVTAAEFDPYTQTHLGLTESTALGLQAEAISAHFVEARRAATLAGVRDRGNGTRNPLAQIRTPVTPRDIEASPFVCWPLRELDLAPDSDGACAMVVARADRAPAGRRLAIITGTGWATDSYSLGERDLWRSVSLSDAARRAYAMAGLNRPTDASLLEVSARSTFEELVVLTGLGLADASSAMGLIESGATAADGDLPVNPSGGLRCACPPVAAGLVRAAEVTLQLSGRAGEHQVANAGVGIAHGTYGQALQSNVVVTMASVS